MPRIMKSLNTISRCQSVFRSRRLSVEGLCPGHHTFVLVICRMPGCSQEELAREICLNKSTVARTLNHLEQLGLVERRATPGDKRQLAVFPTEKMLGLLPEVRAAAREWNNLLAEGIDPQELEIFHSVLSRMEARAREVITEQENFEKGEQD